MPDYRTEAAIDLPQCRSADSLIIIIVALKMGDQSMIAEMGKACLLMRTRLLSRVIASIYDKQLRGLKISSAQFALLVAICQIQPATRAEIGRQQHLDRSTLTRHLKVVLSKGWVAETRQGANGRSRPILLTETGADLLRKAEPACQEAEVQAKALFGEDGVTAVMDIASRVVDPEIISR